MQLFLIPIIAIKEMSEGEEKSRGVCGRETAARSARMNAARRSLVFVSLEAIGGTPHT